MAVVYLRPAAARSRDSRSAPPPDTPMSSDIPLVQPKLPNGSQVFDELMIQSKTSNSVPCIESKQKPLFIETPTTGGVIPMTKLPPDDYDILPQQRLPDLVIQTEGLIKQKLPPTGTPSRRATAPIAHHQPTEQPLPSTAPMTPTHSRKAMSESPGPVRRVRFGYLPPPELEPEPVVKPEPQPEPEVSSVTVVPPSPRTLRRSLIPMPKLMPKPRQ